MDDIKNELKHNSSVILRLINETIVGEDVEVLTENLLNSKSNDEISTLADMLLDVCWEKLNTGYWKNVDISWRYLFSVASFYKAVVLVENNEIKQALVSCDKGLLMGAPIKNNILARLASKLHEKLTYSISSDVTNAFCISSTEEDTIQQIDIKKPVVEERELSLMRFMTNYYRPEIPVLITGSMAHWPAVNKWNMMYIRKVAGFRTVPVEIGSKYTDDNWSQKLTTINEFIDEYIENRNGPVGYLAQHQLFDQITELSDDICIPEYCLSASVESEVDINAWFGPANTVSPLHFDPRANIFAQIYGTKYVRLYAPSVSTLLYPHDDDRMLKNTSQVDVENPNKTKYPLFEKADYLECVVKPGQMLYIPRKWWHFVKSLSNSFSVSYWFGEVDDEN